ncbi:PREDICTED: putative Ras-related protein Rab-42 [Gekko japonicus]|uniref:Ras-related protein Rab-42 n=1 Tax=Gekko japonicus TaxID=146911 RepID=A0ABM1L2X8_GEKJA|nr:PREDICTED: putative Ras-related protein Rab-42 [Gekko japonicus]
MAADSAWHYQFRIIMLGDSTVGKSSLLKCYTEGVFLESTSQTVGVDFYVHFLEIKPGLRIKLQLSVTRSYYRNSAGGMLMFDLTNRVSFESIKKWHQEVMETVKPYHVAFVLVGHKSDLEAERKVGQKEAEKLASSLGAKYIETSAKTSQNVKEAFQTLTSVIYEALESGKMRPNEQWDGVKCKLPPEAQPKVQEERRKKKCSC